MRERIKVARKFEKDTLAILRQSRKDTPWRINKNALFRERDGYFLSGDCTALVTTETGEERLTIRFRLLAKPMSLDPILWDILKMPENTSEPLSLRHWGAFQCHAPVVAKQHLPLDAITPEDAADQLLTWLNEQADKWLERCADKPYVRTFDQLDEQDQGLSPAITKTISHIDAGETSVARQLAVYYAAGKGKVTGMTFVIDASPQGNVFEKTIEWLDRYDGGSN